MVFNLQLSITKLLSLHVRSEQIQISRASLLLNHADGTYTT